MGCSHDGTYSTGCSHDGTQRDILHDVRPPRDSLGGTQARQDSAGIFTRATSRSLVACQSVLLQQPSRQVWPQKAIRSCRPDTQGLLVRRRRCLLAGSECCYMASHSPVCIHAMLVRAVCVVRSTLRPLRGFYTQKKRVFLVFYGVVMEAWGTHT